MTLLFASVNIWSQVTITETTAWLESASVKWTPFAGADSYNVYYTGGGQTDKKIDTQLIRSYGTYFRADVLGLAAGSYTLKIVPVISGTESIANAAITGLLTVKSHNREGFAFANGIIPGAYNMDGTPKTGAKIIYITGATANTVAGTVLDNNGTAVPATGLVNILSARGAGYDKTPLIIRLIGTLRDNEVTGLNAGNFLDFRGSNATTRKTENITFEGVGEDAFVYGYGFGLKRSGGIEIRNVGITMFGDDAIGMDGDNSNIWVHNNDFFYGKPGSDADQVKGDGTIDMKANSSDITISYNHFWDSGKAMGCGGATGETSNLKITFHHNWFDHIDSRAPRLHYITAHVYNNYYDGVSVYSIGNTTETSAFIEGNYFRNSDRPMMISGQGTDKYDTATGSYSLKGTFSGQAGGMTKAYNNKFDNSDKLVYHTANPTQFDAYLANTRNEIVPPTVVSFNGAWPYNNFDTDPTMYISNPDSPDDAKANAIAYAGRINKGDFKWTFDNSVDDNDHEVNLPLKAAILAYQSALVSVQGEASLSAHTLSTPANKNQSVPTATAINAIVFSFGGDAINAAATDLPAGLTATADTTAKTLTITGTPTATGTYTITTVGNGTAITQSGAITLTSSSLSDEIHNFDSGTANSFYNITPLTGSLSTSKGTVIYKSLIIKQCIKTGSGTVITYTTTQPSTLTLLVATAGSTIKVDNVLYTAVAAVAPETGGVITVSLLAGSHTIAKGSAENALFYMKTSYGTLGIEENNQAPKFTLYPNPVTNTIFLSSFNQKIEKVEIYNMTGTLVKSIGKEVEAIDVSNLSLGIYLVKVTTDQGTSTQRIIKQ
ncbi:Por secretion system C-terminal sorting domain-containing protein [Flavobacterium fluvii]|uniref:Por secretion system C-terminal sorting domain-containing protein n=1 Tax=Flavobacterium fluvii TaxID=468056 RepID=A0A1M5HB21_9FLAO|nr:T9SS type A sorting domain-containing protein [Flavobacterium fluvii]SHG13175.1 Por secretion system C-terminal sorting domain-containing protein [Flavobacterium fluvii]